MKPYGVGYEAPTTQDLFEDRALLEMEGGAAAVGSPEYFPEVLNLQMYLEGDFYENDHSIERIDEELSGRHRSLGITSLYKPGYVVYGPTERWKPRSKLKGVRCVFSGRGAYLNDQEQQVPFTQDSFWGTALSASAGSMLYYKPFAVTNTSLSLLVIQQWIGRCKFAGLDAGEVPLYAYGGYWAESTNPSHMEQMYFFVGDQLYQDGRRRTGLGIVSGADIEKGNGLLGLFEIDIPTYKVMPSLTNLETETVGQSIWRGALSIAMTLGQEKVSYTSYDYSNYRVRQGSGDITCSVHFVKNIAKSL